MAGSLRGVYRQYLRCLNERRWPQLGEFVADRLSYNGNALTLADYRAMLEADVRAIPDLEFRDGLLLVDGDMVACRLLFDCTPVAPFLGFEPNGRRVSFSENVFYRFHDQRIVEVLSVIDREAIRRQLSDG